jgi:hypothetical protein
MDELLSMMSRGQILVLPPVPASELGRLPVWSTCYNQPRPRTAAGYTVAVMEGANEYQGQKFLLVASLTENLDRGLTPDHPDYLVYGWNPRTGFIGGYFIRRFRLARGALPGFLDL